MNRHLMMIIVHVEGEAFPQNMKDEWLSYNYQEQTSNSLEAVFSVRLVCKRNVLIWK